MISLPLMMAPTRVVNENFLVYSIVPPEANLGWKVELFDLNEPLSAHYHKLQRQFILVAEGTLKAFYGSKEPLALREGELVCIDPGVVHSLVPEGRARFFSIDLPGFNFPEDVFFDEPDGPMKWTRIHLESSALPAFRGKYDKGDYVVYTADT